MGIVPLQYLEGQNAETLGLSGKEQYNIHLPDDLKPGQRVVVSADGKTFEVLLRFDTDVDLLYYKNGGILNYMIRKMISA